MKWNWLVSYNKIDDKVSETNEFSLFIGLQEQHKEKRIKAEASYKATLVKTSKW